LPIRYRERIYVTTNTNIQRWRHGWLLLSIVINGGVGGTEKFI
jgi:hypothetical protein